MWWWWFHWLWESRIRYAREGDHAGISIFQFMILFPFEVYGQFNSGSHWLSVWAVSTATFVFQIKESTSDDISNGDCSVTRSAFNITGVSDLLSQSDYNNMVRLRSAIIIALATARDNTRAALFLFFPRNWTASCWSTCVEYHFWGRSFIHQHK